MLTIKKLFIMYKNYGQLMARVERIMESEEAKRLIKKERAMISKERDFWDIKGECFKIAQSMPDLQSAMNGGEIEKVMELCLLNNKRLSIIFHEYKKKC